MAEKLRLELKKDLSCPEYISAAQNLVETDYSSQIRDELGKYGIEVKRISKSGSDEYWVTTNSGVKLGGLILELRGGKRVEKFETVIEQMRVCNIIRPADAKSSKDVVRVVTSERMQVELPLGQSMGYTGQIREMVGLAAPLVFMVIGLIAARKALR